MTLGERIAQLRRAAGLSQEALAERVGISRQAVSKWEKGQSFPDTGNLLVLAELLGVSADELAGLRREAPEAAPEPAAVPAPPRQRRVWLWALLAVVLLVLALGIWLVPYLLFVVNTREPPLDDPAAEPPVIQEGAGWPAVRDTGEFALIWQGEEGWEFLRPGEQTSAFPFGTSLAPSALETVTDTDYSAVKLHEVSCGALQVRYTVNSEEDSSYIADVSTITSGYKTSRGIQVGSSEAAVLSEYGDALVCCLKDSGTVLCRHDFYYAYSPEDACGTAVLFYIDDGTVSGLTVRAGDDMGSEAFQVDRTFIFPVINGQVDFTGREGPEQETVDATRAVYIALNALLTDRNLSAEETYRHRQTVYEGLAALDWPAFAALGPAGQETETQQSLLQYLEDQTALSAHEIDCLQAGRLQADGWYAEWYDMLLAEAFLAAPEQFVRCMADSGRGDEENRDIAIATAAGCGPQQEQAEAAIRALLYGSGALTTGEEQTWGQELFSYIMGTYE